MSVEELDSIAVLKAWLLEHGAYIHPDVVFEPGELLSLYIDRDRSELTDERLTVDSGYNIIAGNDVPRDATVVSVPFSLAITPTLSRSALFNSGNGTHRRQPPSDLKTFSNLLPICSRSLANILIT